ncbi:MAG: hypothetical protein VX353_07730 [Actinomycetota bacterium]
MFIKINADKNVANIHEAEALTAFEIRAIDGNAAKAATAIGNGAYVADDQHVWVPINWILDNVGEQVAQEWKTGFLNMVDYAKTKDWVNEEETHLQAHIEIVS